MKEIAYKVPEYNELIGTRETAFKTALYVKPMWGVLDLLKQKLLPLLYIFSTKRFIGILVKHNKFVKINLSFIF